MTTSNRLAYIQARLQARHGARPSEDRWRLLEATPDLGSYLQAARGTSLRAWVVHLSSEADTHQMERSLRADWRIYAAEIASWCAPDWQAPVSWLAYLPYLPHFAHLARDAPAPRWMLDDAVLSEVAKAEAHHRHSLLHASPLGEVTSAIHDGRSPVTAWLDAWVQRFPRMDKKTRNVLEHLRQIYEKHLSTILDAPHGQPFGPALRQRLGERLHTAFRNHAGRVPAVFAHLGLMALDIERLRAGMVLRALFREPAARPRWA